MSSMDALGQSELIQILAHGGSLRVSSVLGQNNLVHLAANMKPGSLLVIENAAVLPQSALVQISAVAKGIALFE